MRHDTFDQFGKLTLRRAGQLHHLGVGRSHAKQDVLIHIDKCETTVADKATGEILGTYDINPDSNYWANKTKKPGRWPSN